VWVVAEVTRRNLRRIEELIDRIGDDTTPLDDQTRPAPATTEFDAVESKLTLMEGRVRGALHEAQDYRERVGALLKALEEAVILFEGERVVLVAGAVQNLLGWKSDEVSGREADDLFPPNASLFRLLRARWQSGEPAHNAESEWATGAGLRRLSVNIDFIPDGSDPLRTLTLLRIRDAEGATEVESQLQVVSRLEAINRLTGGVAHEIKNPLNAIAARVALIESIIEGDAEAEKEIRIVADEIHRLDRVVRTFLDFTQPLQLSREELDLSALTEGVVAAVEPDARNRGVSLRCSGEPGAVWARGDRDLLHQALLNIIVNAVEATPAGGQVHVEAFVSDGACRLRITDTGSGIPEPVKNKIFQLYFTTKSGGSGIGLAVAYRSLQLHGGDIKVESQVGEGTSFELTIPALQKEAVAIA
jgi:signal transduction histidine kinase